MTSDTIIITPKVFKLSSVQSALPQLVYQQSYENEELRLVRGSRNSRKEGEYEGNDERTNGWMKRQQGSRIELVRIGNK